jgi:hypothetical protein
MRRREFITLVSGAAARPLAAHAQQSAMPVIRFMGAANDHQSNYAPLRDCIFRQTL